MKVFEDYKHDEVLGKLATERVGDGKTAGFFITIGNYYTDDEERSHPIGSDQKDCETKTIGFCADLEDAQQMADEIFVGEDSGIAFVEIESKDGTIHERFVKPVIVKEFQQQIYNMR